MCNLIFRPDQPNSVTLDVILTPPQTPEGSNDKNLQKEKTRNGKRKQSVSSDEDAGQPARKNHRGEETVHNIKQEPGISGGEK